MLEEERCEVTAKEGSQVGWTLVRRERVGIKQACFEIFAREFPLQTFAICVLRILLRRVLMID